MGGNVKWKKLIVITAKRRQSYTVWPVLPMYVRKIELTIW